MFFEEEREAGFSLIELLVVIVIIGILSTIAIGVFLNQRQKANDAAVESDVRRVVQEIETMRVDMPNARMVHGLTHYKNTDEGRKSTDVLVQMFPQGGTGTDGTIQKSIPLSEGVSMWVQTSKAGGVDGEPYTFIRAGHDNGSKYHWDANEGMGGAQIDKNGTRNGAGRGDILVYYGYKGGFQPAGTSYSKALGKHYMMVKERD